MLAHITKESFVIHHNNVYGDLAIWVAIEILDFGSLSKLFSGMIYSDQQKFSSTYSAPIGNIFSKWLRSLIVTTPFLTQLVGRNNLFFILHGTQVIE